ncbi:MAG: fatty acid desaturase, partial [Pseudomonadota bacterium]
FRVSHNANHHRYRHGPRDVARTYRFAGGDTNSLMGYLLHPCQVARVLYPLFWRHLRRLRRGCPAEFRAIGACYGLVMVLWLVAASLSPAKALLYLVLPQLIALHWLLGANYLQHAHADGLSRWNYARNFEGAVVNRLYFNIGLHTAHHEHPGLHWSRLPVAHAALRARIHPQLLEPGLLRYVARVYLGSLVRPRWRSRSLQAPLVSWLPCPVALPSSSAAPPSA